MMRLSVITLALIGAFFVSPSISAPAPKRIVSTHLCADQLLLLLAAKNNIVSLSYFASDPNFSVISSEAKQFPKKYGFIEEILQLRPDIVFTGGFSARPTTRFLKRAGVKVVELPISTNFEGIRENIRKVANAVGQPLTGDNLIEKFNFDLALESLGEGASPIAALYFQNGYMPGKYDLAAEITRRAGFDDLSSRYGINKSGYLQLEQLILLQPDILVIPKVGSNSLAERIPHHPALRSMLGGKRIAIIPEKLWTCGGPFVTEALLKLRHIRREMW